MTNLNDAQTCQAPAIGTYNQWVLSLEKLLILQGFTFEVQKCKKLYFIHRDFVDILFTLISCLSVTIQESAIL